ncbi:site-specific integrase [Acidiferrobacter sp.]|uniref:site-specific integrase n=1 Tax=Acidiferrobacter sp. TaxID=1872107 RepID=UPI002629D1FA|nr:site-specific integrase [Acidiferrobacter sp.]
MAWMEAGIRTGLRPGEWAQATLDHPTPGGRAVLTVPNAKHTNGRGHGVLRRIALLTPETEEWVRRHLALLRERQIQGISFTTHYRNTRRALNRAYQRAGTRGPSLYSARHQFKTNARAAGISAWDLAYLMGHAATSTAQCHYGRGRTQTSAFTVAPAPAAGDPTPVIRVGELSERPDRRIGRMRDGPRSRGYLPGTG